MITTTYALSGLLLAGAGWLFAIGALSATGQTVAWTVIFFFASAAASSAYLTVSETFPLEIRALAIAFFYGDLEQYPLFDDFCLAERAVAALVPKGVSDRGPFCAGG